MASTVGPAGDSFLELHRLRRSRARRNRQLRDAVATYVAAGQVEASR